LSTSDDPRPLLTLLNMAAQRERDALVRALVARGFAGIGLPEVRLLAELGEEARSIKALAAATATTKQYCGREVKKLAGEGYVSMAESTGDRRVILVSLRARGRRLLDAARVAKHELDGAVARRLGGKDAHALRRLLVRLVDGPTD
jgi:DNA-binding MarR family transcriptional regulator